MCLNLELGLRRAQGWPQADIQGNPVKLTANTGCTGVDSVWWQIKVGYVEICGRKAQFSPHPVSRNHLSANGIWPAEHLACRVKISCPDRLPYPGATDNMSVK